MVFSWSKSSTHESVHHSGSNRNAISSGKKKRCCFVGTTRECCPRCCWKAILVFKGLLKMVRSWLFEIGKLLFFFSILFSYKMEERNPPNQKKTTRTPPFLCSWAPTYEFGKPKKNGSLLNILKSCVKNIHPDVIFFLGWGKCPFCGYPIWWRIVAGKYHSESCHVPNKIP